MAKLMNIDKKDILVNNNRKENASIIVTEYSEDNPSKKETESIYRTLPHSPIVSKPNTIILIVDVIFGFMFPLSC
jgi:hypothetical protein